MATVNDIINKKGSFVACVDKDVTVLDATREMNEKRIGALVVCDQDKVVGIVSERDILTRVVAVQVDPSSTPVKTIMTSPLACCRLDTSTEECKTVMTEKRIRHLPVVEKGHLKGIVTSGDILHLEKKEKQATIQFLSEYIHGPYPLAESD